jgi:hypothetical protein
MDTLITQEAISADFDFTTSWSNEKTIILTPPDSLGYCTEYTVTVTDGVRDTSGTKLDGEKNSNYLPPVG